MTKTKQRNGILARHPWLVAIGIALATLAWMLSGQSGDSPDQVTATTANPTKSLQTVQVRLQEAEPIERFVTVYGRTAPARSVELKAETRGRIVEIGARRGQQVMEGAVLARLDERDRSARLAEALATVRQREIEYEAQKPLLAEGYITDGQLALGAANLERARSELRRAQLDLEYMTIRAPFDGAVQERYVEVGDFLESGDPLARFVDNRKLIVTGSIAEQDVATIRGRTIGRARLVTGEEVEGTIRYLAPVADETTRTFTIELELDNSNGALPAGVTAELRIPGGDVLAHRVSPALLTLDDQGLLGIKLVDDSGIVDFYEADIVVSSDDGVWITGLPDQAAIISVGQGFVRDGERVAAVEESLDDSVMTAESER